MINWTEEDVKFITETMILPCIEQLVKQNTEIDNLSHETYQKIFKLIVKRTREIDYEIQRDRSCFLSFLGLMHHYSQDEMNRAYKKYCEEFDQLNKHMLEDSDEKGT